MHSLCSGWDCAAVAALAANSLALDSKSKCPWFEHAVACDKDPSVLKLLKRWGLHACALGLAVKFRILRCDLMISHVMFIGRTPVHCKKVLPDMTTWAGQDTAPCLVHGSSCALQVADLMVVGWPCHDWSPIGKRSRWQGDSVRCLRAVQAAAPRQNSHTGIQQCVSQCVSTS